MLNNGFGNTVQSAGFQMDFARQGAFLRHFFQFIAQAENSIRIFHMSRMIMGAMADQARFN